jgi:hypothetical protein
VRRLILELARWAAQISAGPSSCRCNERYRSRRGEGEHQVGSSPKRVQQDHQAARLIGAESLSGGTTTASIFEVVLSTRPQFEQWNKWLIISRASKVDRVHFMSM